VSRSADFISNIKSRAADRTAQRKHRDLIRRIGELTYAQRTDSSVSYETEIAAMVEDIRHLLRTEELRHRKDIADPQS
jgi:hypothetical protein